jgi:hypothetical protein
MRTLLCLFLLCAVASAEKLNVKVIDHHIGEEGSTKSAPGGDANASAGCGAAGNAANCSSSSSGDSLYARDHEVPGSPNDIVMTLLLPDGRKVVVGCEDHLRGLAKGHRHNCKSPMGNEMEANFSGSKAKLTWAVGNGKKKDSETFLIVQIIAPSPARTLPATSLPATSLPATRDTQLQPIPDLEHPPASVDPAIGGYFASSPSPIH